MESLESYLYSFLEYIGVSYNKYYIVENNVFVFYTKGKNNMYTLSFYRNGDYFYSRVENSDIIMHAPLNTNKTVYTVLIDRVFDMWVAYPVASRFWFNGIKYNIHYIEE